MRKLLLTPFLLLPLSLNAQQRTPPAEHDTALPVTHVSLYKNGVGFFEHTGHVTGDAAVTLSTSTPLQLNDVLQSLTAIDLNGGRISGAGYNSTTPLDQQLKNLPLTLRRKPHRRRLLQRHPRRTRRSPLRRGHHHRPPALHRNPLAPSPSQTTTTSTSTDRYFITVVADSGEVRTLELTSATTVRLTTPPPHRRHPLPPAPRLQSQPGPPPPHPRRPTAPASRELRVSYISEVPIWKSTYRILFTDHQ